MTATNCDTMNLWKKHLHKFFYLPFMILFPTFSFRDYCIIFCMSYVFIIPILVIVLNMNFFHIQMLTHIVTKLNIILLIIYITHFALQSNNSWKWVGSVLFLAYIPLLALGSSMIVVVDVIQPSCCNWNTDWNSCHIWFLYDVSQWFW